VRLKYACSVLAIVWNALGACHAQLPAPKSINPNPWNGTWRLNVPRSSSIAAETGVPRTYRFTLGPGNSEDVPIKWEIPELGEIVTGHTDGKPMLIKRLSPDARLFLEVRAEGTSVLRYVVRRNGTVVGGGRMMLVDSGTAWVDITWPEDRQDLASELIYVKQ
jgi:hypothetical protein